MTHVYLVWTGSPNRRQMRGCYTTEYDAKRIVTILQMNGLKDATYSVEPLVNSEEARLIRQDVRNQWGMK